MATPTPELASQVLLEQLEIVWGFAERFVLPQIDIPLCTWEPSENTVTVHQHGDQWSADWPEEELLPLGEATVGWLLWHIDWWWGNAVRACRGSDQVAPQEHLWGGSVTSIRASKEEWEQVLRSTPLESAVTDLMPEERPLWFVAGWVNFELTKNISEIGQLIIRRANVLHSCD